MICESELREPVVAGFTPRICRSPWVLGFARGVRWCLGWFARIARVSGGALRPIREGVAERPSHGCAADPARGHKRLCIFH